MLKKRSAVALRIMEIVTGAIITAAYLFFACYIFTWDDREALVTLFVHGLAGSIIILAGISPFEMEFERRKKLKKRKAKQAFRK